MDSACASVSVCGQHSHREKSSMQFAQENQCTDAAAMSWLVMPQSKQQTQTMHKIYDYLLPTEWDVACSKDRHQGGPCLYMQCLVCIHACTDTVMQPPVCVPVLVHTAPSMCTSLYTQCPVCAHVQCIYGQSIVNGTWRSSTRRRLGVVCVDNHQQVVMNWAELLSSLHWCDMKLHGHCRLSKLFN